MTTFVTPANQKHSSPNVSTPNVSTPSQVPPIQKLKGTPSTVETMESSVSYKSPEPFSNEAQPNVNVPVSVGESNEVASVSTVGTSQLLPSMLARCVGVCNGCMMQFHLCHEAKWRDTCLHAVVDYFDLVSYNAITKHGIREAYYERYMVMLKTELLGGHGLYELDNDLPLPACMLRGSFQEALGMEEYNTTFCYLERNRMHGVKGYVKNRNNPAEVNMKRYGEE